MSEPSATNAREQPDHLPPIPGNAETQSGTGQQSGQASHQYTLDPSTVKMPTVPLFAEQHEIRSHVPAWLRPFFSIQWQLTGTYILLLGLIVLVLGMFYRQHLSLTQFTVVAIVVIILGGILAYLFTALLLRSLFRVTDAAQAIALGDLKQRKRLPLRLPPQDEIDRLAGSLNEMVTRLEVAEEMQLATEQRFRRFFSDASHQLRTPLTSLRGFTEVLLRGAKDDPETAQRVLTLMKNEAERMTILINDLLTLARLDDSRPLKTQYVDLIALAAEGIEQTRIHAKDDRAISLSILTQERLGLKADPDRLKQLLFVLLDNALKYGRPAPDGFIRLQLEREDGHAIIRISDNGEGIASDDLAHIFDAFYRGRHKPAASAPSNGTPIIGTGLGLPIAVSVVRAHHGTISVYSEPTQGTTFTVNLPCVD